MLWGNADLIAESASTRILTHSFVKAFLTGIPSAKMAAKPPPEPVEPLEPSEPVEPRSLKAGMSGFEWLVTTYHFRTSPFIKIDAKLCIKILANADPAIESAFP